MNINFKSLILIIIQIVFVSNLFANLNKKLIKIIPNNPIKKINFIKNNYEVNKKYKVNDDVNNFKKLLIGKWLGPPHADFIFNKKMEYIMTSEMAGYYKETGVWKIKNSSLMLKSNNQWKIYEIDYYVLDKFEKRNKIRYTMSIIFKQMLNGTSDALVISFYYK